MVYTGQAESDLSALPGGIRDIVKTMVVILRWSDIRVVAPAVSEAWERVSVSASPLGRGLRGGRDVAVHHARGDVAYAVLLKGELKRTREHVAYGGGPVAARWYVELESGAGWMPRKAFGAAKRRRVVVVVQRGLRVAGWTRN